jgi:predicted porin
MKKTIIAAAVAASVAAPAAFADVTVYGKIHQALTDGNATASVNNVAEAADVENQTSNASRVGFKGTEDLGNGMSAFFLMEWAADTTDAAAAGGARDGYVGLKGDFGTLAFGRMAGATKATLYGTGNDAMPDSFDGIDFSGSFASKADRHNDVVAYKNGFNGVNVTLAAAGNGADDNFANTSIGLDTTVGGVKVAIAQLNSEGNGKDTTIAGAKMSFDALTVGVVYEDAENVPATGTILGTATGAAGDQETTGVSATYKMGNNVLGLAYVDGEYAIDGGAVVDFDATWVTLTHNMSKRTSVYAQFGDMEITSGANSANADGYTLGLVHKF